MFNINFSAKIKEAEDHVKQGEKYLKTSLTKWKPDNDSAIEEFDKACTCYRVAEKYEQCRDLSIRLAELQIQKGTTFFAAKSYEQAAQMTQQLKDLATAAKYYDKAGQLYAEGGKIDVESKKIQVIFFLQANMILVYYFMNGVLHNFNKLIVEYLLIFISKEHV